MPTGESRARDIDALVRETAGKAANGDRRIAGSDWALAALGGYGRGRLAPFSDIDLALIHSGLEKDEVNALTQELFYPMWDAGLKLSHTVRSLKEGVSAAGEDIQWMTAALDSRMLAGDKELFEEFRRSIFKRAGSKHGRPFYKNIVEAARERWRRFGNAGRLREPEIKESHGGLRDIQIMRWLAKVLAAEKGLEVFDEGTMGDPLVAAAGAGLIASDEAEALIAADDFLWKLRCLLHETAGRDLNRVRIDWQNGLAKSIFPASPRPHDLFNRELFRSVRLVAQTSERFIDKAGEKVRPKGLFGTRGEPLAHPGAQPSGSVTLPVLLEFLRRGDAGMPELERLSNSGALEELIPEWANVKGLSFIDPNHSHPVDTHLISTVCRLVELGSPAETEPGAADPAADFNRFLAAGVIQEIEHPDWLLLAGLLHDIGKGGQGGHAETGADITAEICARLGLERHAGEVIGFLVRHHLLLSHVSSRRDLNDPRVIDGVAAIVGDGDRLRMLYLLTLADAMATGPNVWNSWKSALVDELFLKALKTIEGRSERDCSNQIVLTEKHFALLDSEEEIVTAFEPGKEGLGELTVVGPDRPGLISKMAGVLALNRINVLAAGLYGAENGQALEVFRVAAAFEPEITEEMYGRLKSDIRKALAGQMALSYRLDELARRYRRGTGEREAARVVFDNEASDDYTVIEVHAQDELGILYEITTALAELDLDVHFAKASTFGERAVDVFYISDLAGGKIKEEGHLKEIEKNILFRLSRFS